MSDSSGTGIDLSGALAGLAQMADNIKELSTKDMSDPQNLLKMQQALAKYQEVYGTLSAVISDVKSTTMAIIQKT